MKNENSIDWALFRKALKKELNEVEKAEFHAWLEASPKNREYFRKAENFYNTGKEIDLFSEKETELAFSKFKTHTGRNKITLWRLTGIAASVMILLSVSLLVIYKPSGKVETGVAQTTIPPGEPKATLTLSNGLKVIMEKTDTLREIAENQSVVRVEPSGIVYNTKTRELAASTAVNTLDIPHGGEFRVKLSDGTQVWLNSETRLEYPVEFPAGYREVKLSGEAYFVVATDSLRPFIVHTPTMNIRVLGTSFNFSSYPDDRLQVITLTEGKVKVSDLGGIPGEELELLPDQQLLLNKEKMTSEIRNVDARIYSAWTRGSFIFEDESLEQIFSKLDRWYDIKVFYKNGDARNEKLTGDLPRFESFEIILKMMEEVSSVHFEIKGNTVIVK